MHQSPNQKIQVGYLSKSITDKTNGLYTPCPIFISDNNIKHIQKAHPEDYNNYFNKLSDIINTPDYVGINPKDKSLQLIKVFDSNVLVALRVTSSNVMFVRSLYTIKPEKLNAYIASERLFKNS